jgi:hypothetical protein
MRIYTQGNRCTCVACTSHVLSQSTFVRMCKNDFMLKLVHWYIKMHVCLFMHICTLFTPLWQRMFVRMFTSWPLSHRNKVCQGKTYAFLWSTHWPDCAHVYIFEKCESPHRRLRNASFALRGGGACTRQGRGGLCKVAKSARIDTCWAQSIQHAQKCTPGYLHARNWYECMCMSSNFLRRDSAVWSKWSRVCQPTSACRTGE